MLGAILGDIIGSRFEFNNLKSKEFDLFTDESKLTDDSVMTLATMDALTRLDLFDNPKDSFIRSYKDFGRLYPYMSYGHTFGQWIMSDYDKPYNSFGNGAVMRISPVAYISDDLNDIDQYAEFSSAVTHNHPSAIHGSKAVSRLIFLARKGASKEELLKEIKKFYDNDFMNTYTLDNIRDDYSFEVSCDGTVPPAVEAFLESDSFEDAIRNAISIGGDSDTIAAVTGAIAEAYYGIPEELIIKAESYLDDFQKQVIKEFKKKYNV